jgi:hypothetical protein
MPIKRELRWFYPIDWKELSRRVRFGRAGGACELCGRPHGEVVRCLPDGRWFDPGRHLWRSGDGRPTGWPELAEVTSLRKTRVSLATAHLDHDPGNNRLRNLRALCQRCHMLHDRPHHLARRWITYRQRRAMGDLFLGPYATASPANVPVPERNRTLPMRGLQKRIVANALADRTPKLPLGRLSKGQKASPGSQP